MTADMRAHGVGGEMKDEGDVPGGLAFHTKVINCNFILRFHVLDLLSILKFVRVACDKNGVGPIFRANLGAKQFSLKIRITKLSRYLLSMWWESNHGGYSPVMVFTPLPQET